MHFCVQYTSGVINRHWQCYLIQHKYNIVIFHIFVYSLLPTRDWLWSCKEVVCLRKICVLPVFSRVGLTHISVFCVCEMQVGDARCYSTGGWREDFSGSVKENILRQKPRSLAKSQWLFNRKTKCKKCVWLIRRLITLMCCGCEITVADE